ncbi:MAG: bacteriorhodopsin [Halobacteriales archaeon]
MFPNEVILQIAKANPLARPESIWLALGTVLMLLGMVYFIVRGWGVEDPEAREYYVVTILIPAIAAASYLSMFFGFGLTEVSVAGETRPIYWARYADWLFTTPLLLLDLALLVDADRATIIGLIGLDGFMIVTGLVGALSEVLIYRYVWWVVSEIALLFILYYLFTIMTAKASEMSEDRESTFLTLRNLVLVLWFIYPIWWLIGTEGAGIVNLFVETLGFMVLDVTAKVGFGFILLRSRAILGDASAPEPSAEAAAGE